MFLTGFLNLLISDRGLGLGYVSVVVLTLQLKKQEGLGLNFLCILTLMPSLYPQSKYPFVCLVNLQGHFVFIIYFTVNLII